MWKVALIAFLGCTICFASGGRLPRDHGEDPEEVLAPRNALGDACNETSECDLSADLICESGTCRCGPGHVHVNGSCLEKASRIGADCTESAQCEDVKGACENGTCQIMPGIKRKICDETNPDIVADECECEEGFVKSEDELSCLKEAEVLGESCVSSRQCEHLNGTCSDNTCSPLTTTVMSNSEAEVGKQAIASPCSHDDDCRDVNDAVCKESICQCRIEYVPSEDQSECLLLARKAGDRCEIDKQCSRIPDSSCLEGKCVAVAAAGMKTRSNGSPPSLGTCALVISGALFAASAPKIPL